MSNCTGALAELLWNGVMESWQDEEVGSTDELGWYGLFRGPLWADAIDRHNEIVRDDELQREHGYREQALGAAETYEAMASAGFIVEQHSSGAVYAQAYRTEAELNDAWNEIMAGYTTEHCDECGAEAEEYGAGNPVVHEDGCSMPEEEAA
jgi:hypothetical protein